jgi:aminopeptidase N
MRYLLLLIIAVSTNAFAQTNPPVVPGVSKTLAESRKKNISNILYSLDLTIPAKKSEPINGKEKITLTLKNNSTPLQIDFKESADHIHSMQVNGKNCAVDLTNEHIVIPSTVLKTGVNQIDIDLTAGQLSLNRKDEFLYTLLVPDRARTFFPCFDQPDLKARFAVSLKIPDGWKAMTNGALRSSVDKLVFATSDLIPTYLFSIVAGKFSKETRTVNGRKMNFLYRETDSARIRVSMDSIFDLHKRALSFLEKYTGIKYPFQKFDFTAIPDFQYGGMEHVGAIDYVSGTLFLDSGATVNQQNSRANLIAHETSHMWFGDLVTMQWFNDVWMKEVFANFMADKINRDPSALQNYELKFLTTHYPAAYSIDRTKGANPIRQELPNLNEAGSLYGPIIYNKAPIMMRQLELLMGEESFQKGIREYLIKYSFSNAGWPALVSILDKYTPADLQSWNQVWVNTPGRAVFTSSITYTKSKVKSQKSKDGSEKSNPDSYRDKSKKSKGKSQIPIAIGTKIGLDREAQSDQRIAKFFIKQQAERGGREVWPQLFTVSLVYPDTIFNSTFRMSSEEMTVPGVVGKEKPLFIIYNSYGNGYGLFPVDQKMPDSFQLVKDPVMRASAYINLYENLLDHKTIALRDLLQFYLNNFENEKEELNLSLITGQFSDVYWRMLKPAERTALAPQLEPRLMQLIGKLSTPNKNKIIFRTWQNIAQTKPSLDSLYKIWKEKLSPGGVRLTEDDYTSIAISLVLKNYPDSSIMQEQIARVNNPDRKERLKFMLPALSSNPAVRDSFFKSLKDLSVRKNESRVAEALGYLHYPLRLDSSRKYLKESLEMLEEIQRTGDIFFPAAWLNATFRNYQDPEALRIVNEFLNAHPNYNPQLKKKILQAVDGLERAAR